MKNNAIEDVQHELDVASQCFMRANDARQAWIYWLVLAAVKLLARLVDAYIATH